MVTSSTVWCWDPPVSISLVLICLHAVDISLFHDGVHADLNETFLVGKVSDESLHLVKTTYDCLMKAIAQCAGCSSLQQLGQAYMSV